MTEAIRRLLTYYDNATPDQRSNAFACYRRAMKLIDRFYPYTDWRGMKI